MENIEKMYWNHGFFDYPITNGKELSMEYYHELLDGQSNGKIIVEDENGYPILQEYKLSLDDIKTNTITLIKSYDKSDEVNAFILGDKKIWIDKDSRESLESTLVKRLEAGQETASLWYKSDEFIMPIETLLQVLKQVSIYASDTYNVTQRHIVNILNMDNEEDIYAYDYTKGYPSILTFNYNNSQNEESIL